jgi:hypothetical protein
MGKKLLVGALGFGVVMLIVFIGFSLESLEYN